MKTFFIQVEDNATASLIQKLLAQFKGVRDFGISRNKRLNKFIESLEDEEDAAAYKATKLKGEKPVPFDRVVKAWKKNGVL